MASAGGPRWRRPGGRTVGLITLNFAGEGTVGLDPGEYEIGWWLGEPLVVHRLSAGRLAGSALVVDAPGEIRTRAARLKRPPL